MGIQNLFSFCTAQKSLPNKNSLDGKAGKLTSTISIIYRPPNIKELPQQIQIDRNVLYSKVEDESSFVVRRKTKVFQQQKYCQIWLQTATKSDNMQPLHIAQDLNFSIKNDSKGFKRG